MSYLISQPCGRGSSMLDVAPLAAGVAALPGVVAPAAEDVPPLTSGSVASPAAASAEEVPGCGVLVAAVAGTGTLGK